MSSTIILVTGANSGVGFGISKVLACASEAFHVILASRSQEKAEAALSDINAAKPKGTLSIMQLDVTDPASVEAAATQVRERFGRLDVLVNNAGVGGLAIEDVKARYQACLETNVTGPALVSEAFRPLLLASSNPYSIFVGSGQRTVMRNALERTESIRRLGAGGAYQVSKAALNMLAAIETRDYGSDGLKVFVFSPGSVRSNLRGTSEEQRSAWGTALDPEIPGQAVLDIVQGKRDADVGCLVHKDGVYEW